MAVDERTWWLDHKRNRDKIFYGVVVLFVGLLFTDALYPKHPEFEFEGWFGLFSIYGLVAYLGLVATATGLGLLIRRPEDYYDDE